MKSKYFAHSFYDDDGNKWDSKKEYQTWLELRCDETSGKIKNLRRQVKYQLQPKFKYNGKSIREITYVADFTWEENGKTIIADCKSEYTRKDKVYVIKKKLLLYLFQYHSGVEFREII